MCTGGAFGRIESAISGNINPSFLPFVSRLGADVTRLRTGDLEMDTSAGARHHLWLADFLNGNDQIRRKDKDDSRKTGNMSRGRTRTAWASINTE